MWNLLSTELYEPSEADTNSVDSCLRPSPSATLPNSDCRRNYPCLWLTSVHTYLCSLNARWKGALLCLQFVYCNFTTCSLRFAATHLPAPLFYLAAVSDLRCPFNLYCYFTSWLTCGLQFFIYWQNIYIDINSLVELVQLRHLIWYVIVLIQYNGENAGHVQ